jgi:hypothetical protein
MQSLWMSAPLVWDWLQGAKRGSAGLYCEHLLSQKTVS